MKKIVSILMIMLIITGQMKIYAEDNEQRIEDLNASIDELNSEIKTYEDQIKQKEAEIDELESDNEGYQEEIDELEEKTEQSKDVTEQALVNLQNVKNSDFLLDFISQDTQDFFSQLTTFSSSVTNSYDLINEYNQDLKIIKYNQQQVDNNIASINDDIDDIEEQKQNVKDEVDDYQEEIDELNQLIAEQEAEQISAASAIDSTFMDVEDKISLMQTVGISESDYDYVDHIMSKESGWDYTATNSSSGAYGLCQSLPASKMITAGSDYETNPETQMKWCNSYAVDRYGSWEEAYNFWIANNWW